MAIIPGYCSVGTVGHKLLAGHHNKNQRIEVDKKTFLEVRCSVEYLSFSAHADAAGIEELIRMCEPKNLMLVHGEKKRMAEFKKKVVKDFGIPCFDPPNGTCVSISLPQDTLPVEINTDLFKSPIVKKEDHGAESETKKLKVRQPQLLHGRLAYDGENKVAQLQKRENLSENELFHEVTVHCKDPTAVMNRIQIALGKDQSIVIVGSKELHLRSLVVAVVDTNTMRISWNQSEGNIIDKVMNSFRVQ